MDIRRLLPRRKPQPRYALAPGQVPSRQPMARPRTKRSGHGSTLGIVLAIIVTSGFVAGTTATFTAGTTNAGNVFAAAALDVPTAITATPGNSSATNMTVKLDWTAAAGADSASAGVRVLAADYQAAPSANAGATYTCPANTVYPTTIAGAITRIASGTVTYTDTTLSTVTNGIHPANTQLVDGRIWCYKLQSEYPCCASTTPWLSLSTASQVATELGNTILDVQLVGNNNGTLNAGTSGADGVDSFVIYFNQAIAVASYPTGYICTSTGGYILIGVTQNSATAACPKTTATADAWSGLILSGGTVGTTARYTMGTVTVGACGGTYTTGCSKMTIGVRALTAGSASTVSGTFQAGGTANTTYLNSLSGARPFCSSGASTATGLGSLNYRADPTNGRCVLTGIVSTGAGHF